MLTYRCPDPSHKDVSVHLRSNNEKVYECESSHRFFRREEAGVPAFVDLVSGRAFPAAALETSTEDGPGASRPRLNFMVDIPRTIGPLDFNRISLTPSEWKVISKMDGRSTIEEVRLLSGLKAEEAERLVHKLMDAGLIEIRKRGH